MLRVAPVIKVFFNFHRINVSLSHTTGIMNSVHTTTCYFCEINLNITVLTGCKSDPFPSGFLAKFCNFHLYQAQNVAITLSGKESRIKYKPSLQTNVL
jgi:hypothetical protein